MDKKKILVIDDEIQSVDMIRMRLEANNYEVITAYDGLEGLAKVSEGKPDLVLLDLMMPGTDGLEVLRRLKDNPEAKQIPVIVFTCRDDPESLYKAQYLFGVKEYLVKPVEAKDLLAAIKQYI